MQGKYFINIRSRVIHSGEDPCYQGEHMDEENKKWSDSFEELVYCFGAGRKGTACKKCLKKFQENEETIAPPK